MTGRHASGLRERLIALIGQVVGEPPVAPFPVERALSELGLSSIKMVNLMLAVEIEFDLMIPQSDITPENFHSLATVEALLARLTAPAEMN